ncbi:MAG: hypothetical protein AAGD96_11000 [Chloroflexota bacterium]
MSENTDETLNTDGTAPEENTSTDAEENTANEAEENSNPVDEGSSETDDNTGNDPAAEDTDNSAGEDSGNADESENNASEGHFDRKERMTVGAVGPFTVTTRLKNPEDEIDIDDRAAILILDVELTKTGGIPLKATDVEIFLDINFENKNITIGDLETDSKFKEVGKITLTNEPVVINPASIDPAEQKFTRELTIKTGYFSGTAKAKRGPAAPGIKTMNVEIDYSLSPANTDNEGNTPKNEEDLAHMLFQIAQD